MKNLDNIYLKLNNYYYYNQIKFRFPNVTMGANINFYGKFIFSFSKSAKIKIGNNVTFRSLTKYNYVGINKPVSICIEENAILEIGNNTGFSGTSIYVSTLIKIGENCNFGGNTAIWDTDFHPIGSYERKNNDNIHTKKGPIIIGNDVFCGANVLILKKVNIGNSAVIGAGSVITKNVPENEIWAGNPAKFIKQV